MSERFNTRSFTSLVVFFSFFTLMLSGTILFVSPQGRIANWTGWAILGLGKEEWASVHIALSICFVIAGLFHLYFNWGVFMRYLRQSASAGWRHKLEMGLAAAAVAIVFTGAAQAWPPFNKMGDLQQDIKAYWARQSEPSRNPHADEFTLEDYAQRELGLSTEELLALCEKYGIPVPDTGMTWGALAQTQGITPAQLADRIQPRRGNGGGFGGGNGGGNGAGHGARGGLEEGSLSGGPRGGGGRGAQSGEAQGHQPGMGRMSVEAYCTQEGIPLSTAIEKLAQMGIQASGIDTFRVLADRSGKTPWEVADALR